MQVFSRCLLLCILCLGNLWLVSAQNGIIKGRVYDPISNESIPFVNVVIQGSTTGSTTDIDGNYTINNLEPGLYNVQASYVGYTTNTVYEVEVSNAFPAIINITLEENAEVLEAVEIKTEAFTKSEESPVSLRSIGVNEIKRNPGGNRDISRAVQVLPGVASTATFRNDILIRGGAPSENRFYIDGIEVPTINHFATQGSSGGPVGMINVNFVRELDFYSGAFPAARGNALSSVFDFKFQDGNPDRVKSSFVLGSSDFGMSFDGPIGKNGSFLFSARRSYLQLLFQLLELPFLPIYNDAQLKLKYKLNDKNTIEYLAIGAIDNFELNLEANETEAQQYLLGNLPVQNQWNYTNGIKYTNFRKNSYTNVILSRSMLNNRSYKYEDNDDSSEDNLILDYVSVETENKARIENISRIGGFKIVAGAQYEFAKGTTDQYAKIAVADTIQVVDYENVIRLHKWGAFAQVSKSFFKDRLTASVGLRADANNYSSDMNNMLEQLSPRASLSARVLPGITTNFNTGIYYQAPTYTTLAYEEDGVFVNKENGLTYIRCDHVVGGIEFTRLSNAKITLEGFYKKYSNYPFALNDSISLANVGADFGVVGDEAVTSSSEGRAYGLEFLFQQKLYKGFYGIMSYTLSWSEFKDKTGVYIPSSWDTRHILNLVAGYKFGKNWEIGAKWRFATGQPYTPYDIELSSIIPVWEAVGRGLPNYDLLNTERLNPTHQLDLRVDKKFFFNRWNLNVYFDVENVYAFSADLQPNLTVVRDEDGNPIVQTGDNGLPDFPPRYETKFLVNSGGAAVLPSIGLIIEF